jgi:hypothetical protein
MPARRSRQLGPAAVAGARRYRFAALFSRRQNRVFLYQASYEKRVA